MWCEDGYEEEGCVEYDLKGLGREKRKKGIRKNNGKGV